MASPIPPVTAASIPQGIAKWDLIVVVVLVVTVIVVALGANPSSPQRSSSSPTSPNPTIGQTILLGAEVSGRTNGSAVYNFTTTGAYQVTWSANAEGAGGGCTFLGTITNASHESLDFAANSGKLDGGESGFHVLRIRSFGCAWRLKVR